MPKKTKIKKPRKARKLNASGMGTQAWPELRDHVSVLIEQDDTDNELAKALLTLVSEFRKHKDESGDITDLCNAIEIIIYQESIECETAAHEFAKSTVA